ncbi:SubName: Full=Related to quinate transport protein {ECO:0000313/EMBL:CCA70422.1} [Serendipita indica DSM 11827]|nr:SubName: Full=Related to quinate transport protein {ECO:0000313/EMBL:CCA70422.1} [Serendipita indica DSM 11827]
MAPVAGAGSYAAEKRKQLGGKSGIAGLMQNKKVFGLTVFASMGGLLYGTFR